MTLTAEQSSNKERYEAASTAEIVSIIRTAMGEGCIRPCHVFDAVDELICRVEALEESSPETGLCPKCAKKWRAGEAEESFRDPGVEEGGKAWQVGRR